MGGSSLQGGRIALAAQAADNVAVASVEFYVDGVLIATDTSAPYSANWNARKATKGAHTILVRALDASGNAATQTINITVR